MTCDRRDQELLLLAHGALPLPRRLAARAHLRQCAACRRRHAQLMQVSSTLASALSGKNKTPWTPGWGLARTPADRFGPRLLLGLSALLIATTVVALYLAFFSPQESCTRDETVPSVKAAPVNVSTPPPDHCGLLQKLK